MCWSTSLSHKGRWEAQSDRGRNGALGPLAGLLLGGVPWGRAVFSQLLPTPHFSLKLSFPYCVLNLVPASASLLGQIPKPPAQLEEGYQQLMVPGVLGLPGEASLDLTWTFHTGTLPWLFPGPLCICTPAPLCQILS